MSGDEPSPLVPAWYGEFGGCYVPEALYQPLQDVRRAAGEALADEGFMAELRAFYARRCARPTPLTPLEAFSERFGGATIWAKREDLAAGGSYGALSAALQGLLARRMGKTVLLGDTSTGDFGVALGSVGAALGLSVEVFIGRQDRDEASLNVARMEALGVKVTSVGSAGEGGRHLAIAESLRQLAVRSSDAFWATSSLASPAPYPGLLASAAWRVGDEALKGLRDEGVEAEYVVASVGSGTFALGLFAPFIDRNTAQLVGVQSPGGCMIGGRPGVYLGTRSMVLQSEDGQVESPPAGAPGLAMTVAGPQHARWLQTGKVHYVSAELSEAREVQQQLLRREGIAAGLESCFGLAYAGKVAATLSTDQHLLVGIASASSPGVQKP